MKHYFRAQKRGKFRGSSINDVIKSDLLRPVVDLRKCRAHFWIKVYFYLIVPIIDIIVRSVEFSKLWNYFDLKTIRLITFRPCPLVGSTGKSRRQKTLIGGNWYLSLFLCLHCQNVCLFFIICFSFLLKRFQIIPLNFCGCCWY